jgi:hypothetical protein
MRRLIFNLFSLIMLAVVFPTVYSVQAQIPYRVSDRQVQALINRIETRTDTFRNQLNRSMDRSSLNGTSSEDAINNYIADFERATDRLRSRFSSRQSELADVQEVLNRANFINAFMYQNRLDSQVQSQWSLLRSDLNLLASYYNANWSWSNTLPAVSTSTGIDTTGLAYTVSDVQLRTLLKRIEQRADTYRQSVTRSLNRSTINGTNSEDSINRYIADFETATDRLRQRFESRQSVDADAQEVLNRAQVIDGFMRDYRLNTRATNQWNLLRGDLSTLATYYGVSWNWNAPVNQNNQFNAVLTGTYQLNRSQSDNVSGIIDSAVRGSVNTVNQNEDRTRRMLERRLTPPDMLVIENSNNQVTVASNLSPQVTFSADGVKRTETNPNGRTVSVRATTMSSGVEVAYEGDRTNDFYLTFMPMNNGQLRVTRRIYLENRNQTVTINSVYDKVSQVADFSRVNNTNTAQNFPNSTTGTSSNDFVVPNGTPIVATLNSTLNTSTLNEGDRFTMQVTSPSQFSGAVIEGYVSNVERSGRVSGRAQTTLNFETIQLRNGNRYRFSGLIDSVRQPNGDTVSVNNEGAVRDSSQTNRTVTRAGIGAAIGAIIGAIAGGGSGAAIGAGVGAGAGAGTVILQGRDNLELRSGAEVRLTASAPGNVGTNY